MSFRWSRDGAALTSTCVLCGLTTRALSESAIYLSQRGHDAMTCQLQRAETARAAVATRRDGKWASYDYRATRRNTARRQEKEAS
jgi:hypothetical protein